MGDELKKQLGAEVVYTAGSGGVLDVVADGKEIFSKAKTNRFPEADELIKLIKAK